MFYIIHRVITKKIPIEYTQKEMRRESKYVTTKKKKIKLNGKEASNGGNGGQKNYKTYRKQVTKWQNVVLPLSNYF